MPVMSSTTGELNARRFFEKAGKKKHLSQIARLTFHQGMQAEKETVMYKRIIFINMSFLRQGVRAEKQKHIQLYVLV